MSSQFREHHLFAILNEWDTSPIPIPLDRFLSNYFRGHKAIGSKDRKFLYASIYDLIRWRGLLDHLSLRPITWERRWQTYVSKKWQEAISDLTLPPHIRLSFPKTLYQLFQKELGDKQCETLCLISNESAPTTIRVNPSKISRDELLKRWEKLYTVSPTPHSPFGIHCHKKENFFILPEFKEGLFEVQDEGSQLVADLICAQPKDWVLDYCAGSGGKSLAFAHKMEGKGQIFLHDKRAAVLLEAKKRLKRADIQNCQILPFNDPKMGSLKKKMNWILVDGPCSGTGTIRRNPDMKWKFEISFLEKLLLEQKKIFEEALTFLAPTGKIVYATCSILPSENREQVLYFQEKFKLKLEKELSLFPQSGGMDGFYAAVLAWDEKK